ncbi:hypothetical protein BDZ89DRAFT_1043450 [Hymenopellis radicata]|nr:hypothetical protein BDZ89DRAFT_1043450 [Hymenopellis radicata]
MGKKITAQSIDTVLVPPTSDIEQAPREMDERLKKTKSNATKATPAERATHRNNRTKDIKQEPKDPNLALLEKRDKLTAGRKSATAANRNKRRRSPERSASIAPDSEPEYIQVTDSEDEAPPAAKKVKTEDGGKAAARNAPESASTSKATGSKKPRKAPAKRAALMKNFEASVDDLKKFEQSVRLGEAKRRVEKKLLGYALLPLLERPGAPGLTAGAINGRKVNDSQVKAMFESTSNGLAIYSDLPEYALSVAVCREDIDETSLTMSLMGEFDTVEWKSGADKSEMFLLNGSHRMSMATDFALPHFTKMLDVMDAKIKAGGDGVKGVKQQRKEVLKAQKRTESWLVKFYSLDAINEEKDAQDLLLCLVSNKRDLTVDEKGGSLLWTIIKQMNSLPSDATERQWVARLTLLVSHLVGEARNKIRLRNIFSNEHLIRALIPLAKSVHFKPTWAPEKKLQLVALHTDVIFAAFVKTALLHTYLLEACGTLAMAPSKDFSKLSSSRANRALRRLASSLSLEIANTGGTQPPAPILEIMDDAFTEKLLPYFATHFGAAAGSKLAGQWEVAHTAYRAKIVSGVAAYAKDQDSPYDSISDILFYIFDTDLLAKLGRSYVKTGTAWPFPTVSVLAAFVDICTPSTATVNHFKDLMRLVMGMLDFHACSGSEGKFGSGGTQAMHYAAYHQFHAFPERLAAMYLELRPRGWQEALDLMPELAPMYPLWKRKSSSSKKVDDAPPVWMQMGANAEQYAAFETLIIEHLREARGIQTRLQLPDLEDEEVTALGPLTTYFACVQSMLETTSYDWHIVATTTTRGTDQCWTLYNAILHALSRRPFIERLLEEPLFSELRHRLFGLSSHRSQRATSPAEGQSQEDASSQLPDSDETVVAVYDCGWDHLEHGDPAAFMDLDTTKITSARRIKYEMRNFVRFATAFDNLLTEHSIHGRADGRLVSEALNNARKDVLAEMYLGYGKKAAILDEACEDAPMDMDKAWALLRLDSVEGVTKNLPTIQPSKVNQYFDEYAKRMMEDDDDDESDSESMDVDGDEDEDGKYTFLSVILFLIQSVEKVDDILQWLEKSTPTDQILVESGIYKPIARLEHPSNISFKDDGRNLCKRARDLWRAWRPLLRGLPTVTYDMTPVPYCGPITPDTPQPVTTDTPPLVATNSVQEDTYSDVPSDYWQKICSCDKNAPDQGGGGIMSPG